MKESFEHQLPAFLQDKFSKNRKISCLGYYKQGDASCQVFSLAACEFFRLPDVPASQPRSSHIALE